jgi:hypothetical protein
LLDRKVSKEKREIIVTTTVLLEFIMFGFSLTGNDILSVDAAEASIYFTTRMDPVV